MNLEQLSTGLTAPLRGVGIELGRSGERKKVACFNSAKGRVCEEIPTNDTVECDQEGLCSIFITGLAGEGSVDSLASKYGLRAYISPMGLGRKNLTGLVKKEDLKDISELLGRDIAFAESERLRTIQAGYIEPPKVCNLNPLSPQCERYIADKNWYYMGPLRGWIRADGFGKAIKKAVKRSDPNQESVKGRK